MLRANNEENVKKEHSEKRQTKSQILATFK